MNNIIQSNPLDGAISSSKKNGCGVWYTITSTVKRTPILVRTEIIGNLLISIKNWLNSV